jgi:hypothetical protein
MRTGLEGGLILGDSKGVWDGLGAGMQGGSLSNRFNSMNPTTIAEPKIKPVIYINADTVALTSGAVSIAYNLMDTKPNDIFTTIENVMTQSQGTTYRPPLVVNGLGGKNYMNFADTGNRYLETGVVTNPALFASTSPSATATGLTYMFVIKRLPGATRSIFDSRDSTSLPTAGDLLLEVNNSGAITFDYKGGISGTTTAFVGTAGTSLLDDWSILTVKCQLRNDGGSLPSDSSGSPIAKRYALPVDARIGPTSPLDIYVNGVEQQKTITTNTFTNSDFYGDGTFRMLNRPVYLGNKGIVFGTSGTHIAAFVMIPSYIAKGVQTRIENYFRYYYNKPF